MRIKAWRLGAAMVVSGLVVTAVAGCAVAGASASTSHAVASAIPNPVDTAKWLTTGTAAAEYRSTVAGIPYAMPAGVAFPPGLPEGFVPDGSDGLLQKGAAADQAWFTWLCAWEGDYLTASDTHDSSESAAALTMLEHWPTAPVVAGDPGTSAWVDNVITPAKLDVASGVQNDHDAMCGQYPTVKSG